MKTFLGTELLPIDSMLRESNGVTVCKACGQPAKYLYMTDKGYFCKTHANA